MAQVHLGPFSREDEPYIANAYLIALIKWKATIRSLNLEKYEPPVVSSYESYCNSIADCITDSTSSMQLVHLQSLQLLARPIGKFISTFEQLDMSMIWNLLYLNVKLAIGSEERLRRVTLWLSELKRGIVSLNQAVDNFQEKNSAILKVTECFEPILHLLKNIIESRFEVHTGWPPEDLEMRDSVESYLTEINEVVSHMRQITRSRVQREFRLDTPIPAFSESPRSSYLKRRDIDHGQTRSSLFDLHSSLLGRAGPAATALKYTQQRTRRILPMKLNNDIYDAIADSGSRENIIEESLMYELGSSIEDKTSTGAEFTNARGGSMRAIGTCRIPCSFPGESGTYSIVFHVFKKLATPLIMGRKFLDDTKTLSQFPKRLKRLLYGSSKFLRVLHMEFPQRMLRCSVDGQDTLVTADSGSEADLISLDFARRMGYEISRSDRAQEQLLFADGEVVSVYGKVNNVRLDLSSADEPTISSKRTTLHVLPGLTSDVLLGDNTLEYLKAFTKHQNAFFDVGPLETQIPLQYIAWYTRAEEKIKRAFTKIAPEASSRSTSPRSTSEPESESTYQRLARAFDEPTATKILLQGMNFEKRLQAYDHRESQREEEMAKKIGRLRGDARDAAMVEEDLAKRRACEGRKLAVRKYEEALVERLGSA